MKRDFLPLLGCASGLIFHLTPSSDAAAPALAAMGYRIN